MVVTATAPASIGNLSLGFDLLGAALAPISGEPLGDVVEVEAAAEFTLTCGGPFAHKLPSDPQQNIAAHCYQAFLSILEQSGDRPKSVQLHLTKNLPIGSGLGSSASSIVATLAALNAFYQNPLDNNQLLTLMGELEGQISGSVHYDNVAPSFLGGLTLVTEQAQQLVVNLPYPQEWYWVICYSGLSVSTAEARKILPAQYDKATLISFGRQLGVFVHALHQNDNALAAAMIQDVVAEPYRQSLLPGFADAKQRCVSDGALAFGISGSGPTVFALCDSLAVAEKVQAQLDQHYQQSPSGFSHICRLCSQGTQIHIDR